MASITNAISKDHRELVHDYEMVLNARDNDIATRWQNQFIWALARHLVAKEHILHPAFEKTLGERGRIIMDKDRSQHQGVSL